MTKVTEHENVDTTFELTLTRSKGQSSCMPLWIYQTVDTFVGVNTADELPDGYATSVGYGERFRNSKFLTLFPCYPFLTLVLILGISIPIAGITYAVYRWKMGTAQHRYLRSKVNKKFKIWFCISYFLVVLTCVFLIFAVTIMLIANNNILEAKNERSWRLKLADENIHKIIDSIENVHFEVPLENFNQLSAKLQQAIESKAQPFILDSTKNRHDMEFSSYKEDIGELLETFAHCNAYMLHFLDSWRFYDTNATRYAKTVNTMNSRRALQSLRKVREDFANVVYKVIQQNRAFYAYHQEMENLSKDMLTEYAAEIEKKIQFSNLLKTHLMNIETKLNSLGTRIQERTSKMQETVRSLRDVSNGAGYIEFSDALLAFGYVICILMLLIVFLSLLSMPVWYFARFYRKCVLIGGILPLTTAALIFVFYLLFMVAIVYYFLRGMVARDGICQGKRRHASLRSNIIDDCLNNSTIFDMDSPTGAEANFDIDTANIEALIAEIKNMPKRVKRGVANSSSDDLEKFRINKTIIQDIYVEMLKVSVYAPRNIEPFGLVWHANRLNKNKVLQELNCTHAIGNTMVASLHGQVASEMDKLYRTTWRIEAMLRNLPTQLKTYREAPADSSDVTELSSDLGAILNAEKEKLRTSIYRTTTEKVGDCKPVARLYKALTMPACECMVPSMNIFWLNAFVAICLLLLLLTLLLCLEEILRRSSSMNEKSESQLKRERTRDRSRTRERSRARSSSRQGTEHSNQTNTPYSTRAGTPYSTHHGSPYSTRPNTPYSTRPTTPHSSRPDTPYSTRPGTPHSSRLSTSYRSHHVSPYSSKPDTPRSTRARSPERTPTRGTSLSQKPPLSYDPFMHDYNRVEEDPFVERLVERLSRRDILPRHQQRRHHYPSLGHRDLKGFLKYESYPELPDVAHQQSQREPYRDREREMHKGPKHVWKNDTFRYPGPGGSYMSTNQPYMLPRSISKVLERRATSQPNEKPRSDRQSVLKLPLQHRAHGEAKEEPTTSRVNVESPLPPGKVGIILCPCGCGKPSKIYGTKEDIERIRKAGRICIAKRGEHLKNSHLKPLASVVQLKGGEFDEDVA